MSTALAILANAGLRLLDDNDQWMHRFEIHSQSSARCYVVAKRRSNGEWGCSCMGWKSHRHCKHLDAVRGVTRQIDQIDGVGPALARPASATALPGALSTAVRREPKSEKAKLAAKTRTAASFSPAAYKTYDVADGPGSPEQWAAAAASLFDRMAEAPGDRFVARNGRRSPRRDALLAILDIGEAPASLAQFKTAARKRMMAVHPDVGGRADDFRAAFAAYETLALELFGVRV